MSNEILIAFILNTIVTLGGIAIAYWRVASQVSKMMIRMNLMWNHFKKERDIDDDDT